MGAWATGFNMSLGMNRHGRVSRSGRHPEDPIVARSLGPSHRHLISGYPPFIKHCSTRRPPGLSVGSYRMCACRRGRMAEELRDRLLERFEVVYSGYGATDLEIGWPASPR